MATTTDVPTLKINYLTKSQYDTAANNSQINANELYCVVEEVEYWMSSNEYNTLSTALDNIV